MIKSALNLAGTILLILVSTASPSIAAGPQAPKVATMRRRTSIPMARILSDASMVISRPTAWGY